MASDASPLHLVLGGLLLGGALTGHLASRLNLPRVAGYMLAGTLMAGSLGTPTMSTLSEDLATAKRLCACIVMFGVGSCLPSRNISTHLRTALRLLPSQVLVAAIAAVCVAFIAVVSPPSLELALDAPVDWTSLTALALGLSATSPVLVATMAGDTAQSDTLMAAFLWNATLVIGFVLLAISSGGMAQRSALTLFWDVTAGVSAGAVFGAVLTRREAEPLTPIQLMTFLCGCYLLNRVARMPDLTLLIGACSAGVAQVGFGEGLPKESSLCTPAQVAAVALFGLEASAIDWVALVSLGSAAAALVGARALTVGIAALVSARFSGASQGPRRIVAGFLPQAGFALVIVDVELGMNAACGKLLLATLSLSLLVTPTLTSLLVRCFADRAAGDAAVR